MKKRKNPTSSATKTVKLWELLEHMMFWRDFIKHRKEVSNSAILSFFVSMFSFFASKNLNFVVVIPRILNNTA